MKLSRDELLNLLDRAGLGGCIEELLPLPENEYDLSADNPSLIDHIIHIYPRTLEDVRALVGTSLEEGERNKAQLNMPEYMTASCNLVKNGGEVNYEEIRDVANRILHFPCNETEELIANNLVYREAVKKIMEIAQCMPVLLAENLVVNDNETYVISVPLAIFDEITIYGSGSIQFQISQVKLCANKFSYYPNSKGED